MVINNGRYTRLAYWSIELQCIQWLHEIALSLPIESNKTEHFSQTLNSSDHPNHDIIMFLFQWMH